MATRKLAAAATAKTPRRRVRKSDQVQDSTIELTTATTAPGVASVLQALGHEQTKSELAAAAVVGVAAVLIEIELLPGILLGVAAMMVPKLLPGLANSAGPFVKTALGLGYKAVAKTQQLIAEAVDHAQDMLAEIKADASSKPAAPKAAQAK